MHAITHDKDTAVGQALGHLRGMENRELVPPDEGGNLMREAINGNQGRIESSSHLMGEAT
jgi:hypothetical protein